MNIARIEHQRDRTPVAIAIMSEIVLPALRHLPDFMACSEAATVLSGFLVAVDDFSAAIDAAREAIAILAQPEPDCHYTAFAIEHLALICALCDDLAGAAILAGYVDAALARAGATRDFTAQTTYDRLATILRQKLAAPDLARLSAEGAVLTPEIAIARALTVTLPEETSRSRLSAPHANTGEDAHLKVIRRHHNDP
jgi:hypothetical protein